MKESSVEKKAKAYDKVFKKAKEMYARFKGMKQGDVLEDVFPQLKESDNERIRKALVELVHDTTGDELWVDYNVHKEDALAWLKKQGEQKLYVNNNAKEMFIKALERVEEQNNKGYKLTDCDKNSWWEDFKAYTSCIIEQKPADKVEPKFKIGDTITDPTDSTFIFHINKIEDGRYIEKEDEWVLVKEADANYELVEEPVSED